MSSAQPSSDIFNISQTYNYNINGAVDSSGKMMLGSLEAASRSHIVASSSGVNGSSATNTTTTNGSQTNVNEGTVDIQAQFELSVELRRFINIDLFQRGFYHIRLAIKCANKTIPTKIMVQLENSNNNYLSDVMFPSCIIDEYAVSKTFLILYKNEEIILDDQILFKISSLMNAFNILESFEKLDLQLNVELWFTENDYKPPSNGNQAGSCVDTTTSTNLSSGANNLNQTSNGMNTSSNSGSGGNNSGTSMQLLCSRTLKIKFDPRHGLHLQMPVLFDYFHLSSVLVTVHCSLLTLLPPVMLGTNTQRNLTLSSILFGQELSQFKNPADITSKLMSRAVNLHNQICTLLLASYDHLQDHIVKMSNYMTEYERKKLNLEHVDCQEKLHKLTEIAQMCSEAEALDDLANRHVAQLSAENIMLWCLYIDNFTFNQPVSEHLATEYHIRRLKRFSEAFFVKDLPKKHIIDYEPGENYQTIHDLIKQSAYYQQLPELAVSCDELDGLPDQLPIVFEENYVLNSAPKLDHQHSTGGLSTTSNIQNEKFFSTYSQFSVRSKGSGGKNSQSSSTENSTTNAQSDAPGLNSSKKLHKKLKKKLLSTGDVFLDSNASKRAITLVSYKKTATDDQLNLHGSSGSGSIATDHVDLNSSLNSSMMSRANSVNSHHIKLSQIKADLLNSNSSSSEFKDTKTNADDSNVSFGLDQLDLSNINNSSSNLNANEDYVSDEGDETCGKEANSDAVAAEPVDFSIKSRALYESFRGKMNTLEKKPGSAVPVTDGVRKMSQNSTSSGGETTALARTSSSNRRTSSLSTNSSNHLNDSSRSLDVNLINGVKRSNLVNNVVIDRALKENIELNRSSNELSSSNQSVSLQPSPQKSFHFVGENLFKFVLAKEEMKRTLNVKYPGGNIYSEFSSFFCSAPYFYPHLTPKLVLPPSIAQSTVSTLAPASSIPPVTSSSTASTTSSASSAAANPPPPPAFKERKGSFFRRNSRTSKSSVDKSSTNSSQQQHIVQTASSSVTANPRASFTSTISSKAKVFRLSSTDSNANNYDVTSDETVKEKEIPAGSNNNAASNQDYSYYTDSEEEVSMCLDEEKVHLVVCVHGLEGNSGDLRLIRTYLELALPGAKMDFLMSEQNQENTFDDLETMTVQLIKEINHHIEAYGLTPDRISFIGHSLGNLIIRSAVAHDNFKPHRDKLYTYLSLSGPHLGTLYNTSGLVNMGLWIMQKWKRSGSLLQLSLKDHSDLKSTFLYKLSKKPTLEYFKNVLLVASLQDRYVPFHSARIEMCKAAYKDNQYGNLYREMVLNILKPVIENPNITFKRYSTFYSLQSGTSNLIGRAAHIAVLDSELFVEKLVLVSVAKHFR